MRVYRKTISSLYTAAVIALSVCLPAGQALADPIVDAINQTTAAVNQTNTLLTSFSNQDLANALINYQAMSNFKIFQQQQTLLYMDAPGIANAMEAGKAVSLVPATSPVVDKVGAGILAGLPLTSTQGVGPITNAGEDQVYATFATYFQGQLTTPADQRAALAPLNFSALLQSVNLTSNDTANSDSLIRILTNPAPTAINTNTSRSDEDAIVARVAEQAAISVSLNTLNDIAQRRMPIAGASTSSLLQTMETESTWRIKSAGQPAASNWYTQTAVSSTEALLREMVHMMAFSLWMNYQQYRQNEQMTALMAVMLANQVHMSTEITTLTKSMGDMSAAAKASQGASQAIPTLPSVPSP